MFKILSKVTGSFSEINKLVSSANKVADSGREESQRSLTYTVKNRGPTIEPCGTPQRITSGNDLYTGRYILQIEIFDKNSFSFNPTLGLGSHSVVTYQKEGYDSRCQMS